jgi:peptidyl-prolyl cis-trans isomerase B (cyclophilin B)
MANFSPLPGSATVTFVVNEQPISVALDGANAPVTAGNFVDLVSRRFYDGITFHRVVDDFVVQAGDPNSRDPNFPTNLLGRAGFVDPTTGETRVIPLEIKPEGSDTVVLGRTFDDAGITADPVLKNERGTIAMARALDPNSASSQFYFNLVDSPFLDGNYAVFGEITQGLGVIDTIEEGDRIAAARVVDGILPSRVSAFLTPEPLNFFFNRLGRASLPLGFEAFGEGDDVLNITSELSQANPSGFIGFGGNDTFTGSAIDDVLYGNKGNDIFRGEGGDDLLRGGQGEDNLDGGDGNDILHGNIGVDTVTGGAGDDFLRGGQNEDILDGGAGNDILIGDRDRDTLIGGTGADNFVFRAATDVGQTDANAVDVVTDFNAAEGDRLVVASQFPAAEVRFVQSGSDVLVQLPSNDFIGRVQNATAETVSAATVNVAPADLGLLIG